MSVSNSPTKKLSEKMISTGNNSSSQPDLSKLLLDVAEPVSRNVSLRKRKAPDNDFFSQLNTFKKEVLDILKESSRRHNESITTISENTTSIREQLQDIKTTTEHLLTENKKLKSEMVTLKNTVKLNEEKISELQTEISEIKTCFQTNLQLQSPVVSSYNDVITEIQERVERSKNVVIFGIPEQRLESREARQEVDSSKVDEILKCICPDHLPNVKKILRLGKYNNKKGRPLKVCFTSEETA
ncbi:unnamed protein product [Leptidea sinapis]|uniref:L1 transposable element RRM domain-containing protein n=1 Tax=Leptidea sinapis TaxID=189913 RepID=A0A5E4QKK2_9NEOP|nr:unnamed protein product [Leptidea sinapis]